MTVTTDSPRINGVDILFTCAPVPGRQIPAIASK